jgi:hypothetical protein
MSNLHAESYWPRRGQKHWTKLPGDCNPESPACDSPIESNSTLTPFPRGAIYDLTGSYQAAFVNGIAWNVLNLAIALWLLRQPRGRVAHA